MRHFKDRVSGGIEDCFKGVWDILDNTNRSAYDLIVSFVTGRFVNYISDRIDRSSEIFVSLERMHFSNN